MSAVRGLTWDHPRGVAALRAAAALHAARVEIAWDAQSLEGFESRPIAELARDYDLIVLDHPHLGEAVGAGHLVPVDDLIGLDALARIEAGTVGRAASSYRYGGRVYALPLDAATQVQALQPALTGDRPPPAGWDDVLELGGSLPLALSLAGPHALLTFFSICAGIADGGLVCTPAAPVPSPVGLAALELMSRLCERAERSLADANPIALLEAMTRSEAACCPLVYGYAGYAVPGSTGSPLRFCDAPGLGSTLGGTGIAITRRCPHTPELAEHLGWLLDASTQTTFIPQHEGQPSARAAWSDRSVDEAAGGFYSGTRATIEAAWVRPRFDGYIGFQLHASQLIREGLEERTPHAALLSELTELWRAALPAGAEL